MFHVEHDYYKQWAADAGIELTSDKIEKLECYVDMVYESNQLFNITGLKTKQDIRNTLVFESIRPVAHVHVPRGTSFIDIGTGGGIPGIPLAIYCENTEGFLADSAAKRIEFVNNVVEKLALTNVKTCCARIEDLGHLKDIRGKFDVCVTRAFAPVYTAIEMGIPLIKKGGKMYIYSRVHQSTLPPEIHAHAKDVSSKFMMDNEKEAYGLFVNEGLLLTKYSTTQNIYPRKYPAIKRDADKIIMPN